MQLVRGKALETLIAELKHSFDALARLGARLADIRASRSLTRMTVCERGGVAWLHPCHLAEATGKPKDRR
jgi:hypothetical protein